jgi:hypothetical protein
MDKFDSYMEEWSQPLPQEPEVKPPPESIPMEKTVLVDLAGAVENKKTYLEEGDEARKARKAEGTLAPPVDVYEPGFRTDLYAAIKSYFRKQKETRERIQAIREKTGIGRYRTWTP